MNAIRSGDPESADGPRGHHKLGDRVNAASADESREYPGSPWRSTIIFICHRPSTVFISFLCLRYEVNEKFI